MTQVANSPTTFNLQHDFIINLQLFQQQLGAGFISETIRQVHASYKTSQLTARTKLKAGESLRQAS